MVGRELILHANTRLARLRVFLLGRRQNAEDPAPGVLHPPIARRTRPLRAAIAPRIASWGPSCVSALLLTACIGGAADGTSSTEQGSGSSSVGSGNSEHDATSAGGEEPQLSCTDLDSRAFECDLLLQDCPGDRRCANTRATAAASYEFTSCVEPRPAGAFLGNHCEALTYEGDDTCAPGLVCFPLVQQDTVVGNCVEACIGDLAAPACEDATKVCVFDESQHAGPCSRSACLTPCNPLSPACGERQACDAHLGRFYCVPDTAQFADYFPCGAGQCSNGQFCAPFLWSNEGSACTYGPDSEPADACYEEYCQRWCDLGDPSSCPPVEPPTAFEGTEQRCVPWFGTATPPEGLEALGRCEIIR